MTNEKYCLKCKWPLISHYKGACPYDEAKPVTPEKQEGAPFYCDTFKGGVFGPKGLIVPTDELHGNEVPLLMMGYEARDAEVEALKAEVAELKELRKIEGEHYRDRGPARF